MDRSMFGGCRREAGGESSRKRFANVQRGGGWGEVFYFLLVWGLVSKGDTLMDNI